MHMHVHGNVELKGDWYAGRYLWLLIHIYSLEQEALYLQVQ
jgi:hypothetical protein